MNIKIEIKNRWTGAVLFEYEKEENTIKDTLKKAINEGADLRGANLRGAYLEGTNLRGADLRGAYLRGANLRGAYLEGTNLEEADLRGANLRGAYLEGTNLEEADLRGAYLRGAYLEGTIIGYSDYDLNIQEEIDNFKEKTNINKLSVYENHNQIPTRYNPIWKNVLVINKWEFEEEKEEPKEMTVSQVCEELGYEVKIVKEKENE